MIRDVPDDVVRMIDAHARQAGLSRTEYLRRILVRERREAIRDTTIDDLAAFAETFADLGDDAVMDDAWR